ncbi:MAG TPA: hypothetical protein VLZ56_02890 [Mycoplana sp.]|nr:hypothetical protein [Mycoplana sp.]
MPVNHLCNLRRGAACHLEVVKAIWFVNVEQPWAEAHKLPLYDWGKE